MRGLVMKLLSSPTQSLQIAFTLRVEALGGNVVPGYRIFAHACAKS